MDRRFCLDGVGHDTPAGVAHYLEHKMFDTEDGNALQDLAANGVPLYAMAFGLSGLAAGAFRGRGRLRAAGAYLLTNGGAVLWTWDRGLPLSVLYEAILGGAAFLLLPERPLKRLGPWLADRGFAFQGVPG